MRPYVKLQEFTTVAEDNGKIEDEPKLKMITTMITKAEDDNLHKLVDSIVSLDLSYVMMMWRMYVCMSSTVSDMLLEQNTTALDWLRKSFN